METADVKSKTIETTTTKDSEYNICKLVGMHIQHLKFLISAINIVKVLERPGNDHKSDSPLKMCYQTASQYVESSLDSIYVLGYVVLNGMFAFEHAWVSEKNLFYDLTLNPTTATNYNVKEKNAYNTIDYVEVCRLTKDDLKSVGNAPDLSTLNAYRTPPKLVVDGYIKS